MGRRYSMSIAQGQAPRTVSFAGPWNPLPAAEADDPVTLGLRESARRMIGIAVFSGVINILMLSGSLYMLQVYDRVIPSRNIATLLGLSLMVLFAYLVQGYFDALRVAHAVPGRDAVRRRPAGSDPYRARHAAASRREADADAAAAARSRPGARLHVEHGADRVPRHALDSDLSDRVVSVSPGDRHDGAARHRGDHCHDAADRADVARRGQGGDGLERPAAGAGGCDAAQCRDHSRARHDGSVHGALVAGQRALSAAKISAPPTSMPISARARRCCATSCNRECWASAPISSSPTRRRAAS